MDGQTGNVTTDFQVTTFTLFSFSGAQNKYNAFKGMVEFPPQLRDTPGMTLNKLLGVGGKGGFGIFPNLGAYALMCTWDTEKDADAFFTGSFNDFEYVKAASAFQTVYLYNIAAHGTWGGVNPFKNSSRPHQGKAIAVLTRATIRWRDMIRFWKEVPPVSRSLLNSHEPYFAAGIGEMPFRYQATFSIWPNLETMKAYAYKDTSHTKMISKTHQTGWYSESLFARFTPFKTLGDQIISLPSNVFS